MNRSRDYDQLSASLARRVSFSRQQTIALSLRAELRFRRKKWAFVGKLEMIL